MGDFLNQTNLILGIIVSCITIVSTVIGVVGSLRRAQSNSTSRSSAVDPGEVMDAIIAICIGVVMAVVGAFLVGYPLGEILFGSIIAAALDASFHWQTMPGVVFEVGGFIGMPLGGVGIGLYSARKYLRSVA